MSDIVEQAPASAVVQLSSDEIAFRDLMLQSAPDQETRSAWLFQQIETAARLIAADFGEREAARLLRKVAERIDGRRFLPEDGFGHD